MTFMTDLPLILSFEADHSSHYCVIMLMILTIIDPNTFDLQWLNFHLGMHGHHH